MPINDFVCIYVCSVWVPRAHGGQKEAMDPLVLKLIADIWVLGIKPRCSVRETRVKQAA